MTATNTEQTSDRPEELQQVHIYNPNEEFTVHLSITIEPETISSLDSNIETRDILLTEGGGVISQTSDVPIPSDENPFVREATDTETYRTTTHDTNIAIGYFLHLIEIQDKWDENLFIGKIRDALSDGELDFEGYTNYIGSLAESTRKVTLLDMLETRVNQDNDWAAKPYLKVGAWRSTNLSERGKEFAERLSRNIELSPQRCYRTAQKAAIKHKNNHLVEYVEGVVLPKTASSAIRHAWIEYDGEVVELTFPWHRFDGDSAVYFGTIFDCEEVENIYNRRDGGMPLILSDEKAQKVQRLQQKKTATKQSR